MHDRILHREKKILYFGTVQTMTLYNINKTPDIASVFTFQYLYKIWNNMKSCCCCEKRLIKKVAHKKCYKKFKLFLHYFQWSWIWWKLNQWRTESFFTLKFRAFLTFWSNFYVENRCTARHKTPVYELKFINIVRDDNCVHLTGSHV